MQNISKNIYFSLLNILFTAVINLIAIRVLLNTMGSEKFGVFSLVTILNSLSSLFSFGLNYTLLHYLPKQGRSNESNMDIIMVLIMSFAISLVLSLLVLFSATEIFNLIKAPAALRLETVLFIKYVSVSILFLLPVQILLAVFDALQKNYLSNIFQFIFSVLYWGVLAIASLYSSNLNSLGLALACLYPAWFIILWFVFKRTWGSLLVSEISKNYQRVFKKHFKSGTKYFVTNIVGYLNEPISKILISRFIGLETVAFFDIAMRVKNQVWGLFNKLTYPFLPFFSSHQDKAEVKKFIISLTSVILVFASIISLYFLWAGSPILYYWLKSTSGILKNFVVITVASYLMFSAVVFPVYYFFIGENKANYLTLIQLTGSIVNILLFFFIKEQLPQYSIIISHCCSLFVSMLLSFYLYYKYDGTIGRFEVKQIFSGVRYLLPFLVLTILFWITYTRISNNFSGYFFLAGSITFGVIAWFTLRSRSFTKRFPIVTKIAGGKQI